MSNACDDSSRTQWIMTNNTHWNNDDSVCAEFMNPGEALMKRDG
jgi:hypothetical protein